MKDGFCVAIQIIPVLLHNSQQPSLKAYNGTVIMLFDQKLYQINSGIGEGGGGVQPTFIQVLKGTPHYPRESLYIIQICVYCEQPFYWIVYFSPGGAICNSARCSS